MQSYNISISTQQLNSKEFFKLSDFKSQYNWENEVDNFYCSNSHLISIEGAPEICNSFYCAINLLTENGLKGGPKIVKNVYSCNYCSLTSLEGGPLECKHFLAEKNELVTLKGIGKNFLKKCEVLDLSNTPTIQSNILGVVLIKGLEEINAYGKYYKIFKELLKFNNQENDILEAQEWLISNGHKELAKL